MKLSELTKEPKKIIGLKNVSEELTLPSNSSIVIGGESEEELSNLTYHGGQKLPMTFWISYRDLVDDPYFMPDTTPVTLLINPNSFNVTCTKKINANFTRGGYVVEDWGDLQDTIQCDGKIGGYYIYGIGLNNFGKRQSLSLRNLYELIMVYRNNGSVYQRNNDSYSVYLQKSQVKKPQKKLISNTKIPMKTIPPTIENSNNNRVDSIATVMLFYDSVLYKGSFDEFSIEEDAQTPFNLTYNFMFTVQTKYVSDFRTYDYYNQSVIENDDLRKFTNYYKPYIRNAIPEKRGEVKPIIRFSSERINKI